MRHLLRYNEAAKKINPESNFLGYIEDIFIELKDKGFYWYVSNDKTTYTIDLRYRGPEKLNKWGDPVHNGEFKWLDVKEALSMLVGYLSDSYKKVDFNEFSTTIKKIITYRRGRRIERGDIKAYSLNDFQNKLEDSDIMESIRIRCLVRFK